MMTTPRFLQGAFAFEGQGLDKPALLHPTLTYTVPEGVTGQVLYVRAGNSSDELVAILLAFDGAPSRWLPVGAKGDMHVSLRVVEDLLAGFTVEIHYAAPEGCTGTLVVDCGLVEV
jgi:assimilatory nitrate reductase catalytic subunit